MSAIFKLDKMPKSCSECDLRKTCELPIGYINALDKRHPQCPLQDTTELLEALEILFDVDGCYAKQLEVAYNKLRNALEGNINEN